MLFENVCIEAISYTLPDEVVTSEEIERRLAPAYNRLKLPPGRLEAMSGIRERRVWPRGTLPGRISAITARKALEQAKLDPHRVGALVHGSVCRDYLEPATACGVHQALGLPERCLVFDLSNACLGLLNGVLQVAQLIELGQIEAGLVVGTESSRHLLESTIERLNRDTTITRKQAKLAFASLTIGSASAAILLTHRDISRTGNRLLGGAWLANTQQSHLCRSARDETVADNDDAEAGLLMWTDSETLMQEGIATAVKAFAAFRDELGWRPDSIDKTFCHQVGRFHQKLLFESLELDPDADFSTLSWLGNTGSVALPTTAAIGIEQGHLQRGDKTALLGIGSGINVVMLGVQWQRSPLEADINGAHIRSSELRRTHDSRLAPAGEP
ncbi:3-oxoacyl-ACP synthase III [Thermostilla marina]